MKRGDEREEIRWKLWLREKAILLWARLMEVMLWLGRSWAHNGVRLEGYRYSCSVGLCFDLGFPT